MCRHRKGAGREWCTEPDLGAEKEQEEKYVPDIDLEKEQEGKNVPDVGV